MHRHKPVQKQRTHLGFSTNAEAIKSEACRHSMSADRDNLLLLLHRKCPNPLMCVRSIPRSSPPSVPISVPVTGGISPILCQSISYKPRPRQVPTLLETSQFHVAGNSIVPSSSVELLPSQPAARQQRLRRKIYTGKSHSAGGTGRGDQENPTFSADSLWEKPRNTDIYIPTASGSIHPRPPSGSRKLREKVDTMGNQQNMYCVDVVQRGLRVEHVEKPRPLPPRDIIPVYDDSIDISASPSDRFPSRPDSAFSRRCVTDSELCPSRHLVCDQFPHVSHSYSYERPLHTLPSAAKSSQRLYFGATEQALYRVSARENLNAVGNGRDVYADSLQRCSSGHQVLLQSAGKDGRRQSLKKSVVDIGETVPCGDGVFNRQCFSSDSQSFLRADVVSVHNKYFLVIICQPILFRWWKILRPFFSGYLFFCEYLIDCSFCLNVLDSQGHALSLILFAVFALVLAFIFRLA